MSKYVAFGNNSDNGDYLEKNILDEYMNVFVCNVKRHIDYLTNEKMVFGCDDYMVFVVKHKEFDFFDKNCDVVVNDFGMRLNEHKFIYDGIYVAFEVNRVDFGCVCVDILCRWDLWCSGRGFKLYVEVMLLRDEMFYEKFIDDRNMLCGLYRIIDRKIKCGVGNHGDDFKKTKIVVDKIRNSSCKNECVMDRLEKIGKIVYRGVFVVFKKKYLIKSLKVGRYFKVIAYL